MQPTSLGILIMLLATSMTNIGAVLQKRAVDGLAAFGSQPVAESVRGLLADRRWVVGWLLGAAAIVLNMVALGLADISLIQPLNGFGLVVLVLASRLYLGETLDRRTLGGMAAVIVGVVLVGATAPPSRVFVTVDEILSCYEQVSAAMVILGIGAAALFLAWAARRSPARAGILLAIVAASTSVLGLTFSKGFFGLLTSVGFATTLSTWAAYVLLVLLVTCSVGAMVLQQLSLQKGRAIEVTPAFAATSVLLPVVTGRLVFSEQLSVASLTALLLIVPGVVLLGARRPTSKTSPPGEQDPRVPT